MLPDDDDDRPEPAAEPAAPRPRMLPVAAAFTAFAAMMAGRAAEQFLRHMRDVLRSPGDLNDAWVHAVVHAAQARPRIVVAREVAAMVLALLLFVASTRVLLRVPGAGWLWRQALVAQVALAGFSVWVERALVPHRRRAFEEAVRAVGRPVEPLPGAASLDESLRWLLAMSSALPAVWAMLIAGLLLYATRARVRAFTD